jgi:hypothetical protein
VNERLGSGRPVGDIRNDADNGESGVRVLRCIEPPSQPLSDGILSWPKCSRQPPVDDDDASWIGRVDTCEHPAALQADPEGLKIGAVDPRKMRSRRSSATSVDAFGRECPAFVYRSSGRSVMSPAERTPGKDDAPVKRARWKLRTLAAVL